MNALRQHMTVIGFCRHLPVERVHGGTRCIDNSPGAELDLSLSRTITELRSPESFVGIPVEGIDTQIVRRQRSRIDGSTHKPKDKPGVVLHQIAVGVLQATDHLVDRHLGCLSCDLATPQIPRKTQTAIPHGPVQQ